MEAALEVLLPKMLGDMAYQIIRFQCKDDLLKQLPIRLKGYKSWIPENWSILVLVDQDDDNCIELKRKLELAAQAAGFRTKTDAPSGQKFDVINRIVIEELEAWYFGDWNAVRTAYPRVPATIPAKANYRNPDAIKGGTWETLERILKRAGYFSSGLRKAECARQIMKHINVNNNHSHSFRMFHRAVQSI